MKRMLAGLAIILAWCAAPAQADTFTVISGGVTYDGSNPGPLTISAIGNSSLFAALQPGLGVFRPADCTDCVAGGPLSLEAFWVGLDLTGTVQIDDSLFTGVGTASADTSAAAHFFGTMIIPATGVGFASAPFTFLGQFTIFDPTFTVTHSILGGGTATALFANTNGFIRVSQLTYSFEETASQTPEPASLLLMAGGGLLIRRRFAARQVGVS